MQRKVKTTQKDKILHKFVAPPIDSDDEYLPESDSDPEDLEPMSDGDSDSSSDIPLSQLCGSKKKNTRPSQIWTLVTANSAKPTPTWQSIEEDDVDLWEPVDYFKIFFTDNLLQHIVEQSNLYCVQQNPNKALNLTVADLEQFIGVTMCMSIFDLHRTRNYWKEDFRLPQVADVMSRNRYEEIRRYLHFNNNDEMPERHVDNFDRLYKIRPLLDSLVSKCQSIPLQGQMFSVDEQIIPFKRKSFLKTYNPKKPHKWGYKLFALCDVYGTVYNFEIYTGKILPKPFHRDIGASGNIVLQLSNIIPNDQNYLLYFDNWFSSPLLLVELYRRGIGAMGTIRLQRFPGCTFTSDADLKKKARGAYEEK
ncbi:hypothetical protein PPYR_02412 [Photinus pyralis]|uniref:PiggyBac transposable element-derived protein domain-containing protein n=1 Tax=Photinus pyralis TaxID=7054 RepID=A0A5N4B764_PHOPY|nr:hypothetical protein PPYR_02412 [Photinus pyralis]